MSTCDDEEGFECWTPGLSMLEPDMVSGARTIDGTEPFDRTLAPLLIADTSTMTDGSLPLVYEAVNSHGWFDTRHRAHGQRPVHLVFFLHPCQYFDAFGNLEKLMDRV